MIVGRSAQRFHLHEVFSAISVTDDGDDGRRGDSVQPVILRGKPDFDDSLTAAERIHRVGLDTVARCNSDSRTGGERAPHPLLEALAGDFASMLLSRVTFTPPA